MSSKAGLTEKDDFLSEYKYLFETAKIFERELVQLITMVKNDSDSTGLDFMILWAPLVDQLGCKIKVAVDKSDKILCCIEAIKKPKLRAVLQLAYIEGITQEEIAERMNYSTRQIQRLQIQALELVEIVH